MSGTVPRNLADNKAESRPLIPTAPCPSECAGVISLSSACTSLHRTARENEGSRTSYPNSRCVGRFAPSRVPKTQAISHLEPRAGPCPQTKGSQLQAAVGAVRGGALTMDAECILHCDSDDLQDQSQQAKSVPSLTLVLPLVLFPLRSPTESSPVDVVSLLGWSALRRRQRWEVGHAHMGDAVEGWLYQ